MSQATNELVFLMTDEEAVVAVARPTRPGTPRFHRAPGRMGEINITSFGLQVAQYYGAFRQRYIIGWLNSPTFTSSGESWQIEDGEPAGPHWEMTFTSVPNLGQPSWWKPPASQHRATRRETHSE